MFYRDIINELVAWSNKASRKPLVLRGAFHESRTKMLIVPILSQNYQKNGRNLNFNKA